MNTDNRNKNIGIGLSGGIDSAVAAWKLQQEGYNVIGYTMVVTKDRKIDEEAGKVADFLHIPLHVLDLTEPFESHVLSPFVDEYSHGKTPSPCVWCNHRLKFGILAQAVFEDGCTLFATGHYVRTLSGESGTIRLLRGLDFQKDQSYFLAQVPRTSLEHVLFPLGDMQKTQVRQLAQQVGIPSANKPESQDLCFLSEETFSEFILRRRPELQRPGWIVSQDGKRLGKHTGAFQFTYGQRRGLGLGGGPWFVSRVDVPNNCVVVAHGDEMTAKSCSLYGVKYGLLEPEPGRAFSGMAQVRYRMTPRAAIWMPLENDCAKLIFDEPVPSVTPGQLAVLYDGDEVIASGWITTEQE